MSNKSGFNEGGFTLIEIITVIVVLSILAALGGSFVVESTKSYQSTQTRSRLVNTGRQAVERISRQLRIALPYSARITNGSSCLEFIPITSGGNYVTAVADAVNGVTPNATINVSPYVINFGAAQYVSIGAMSFSELYGVNPASLSALSSQASNQLVLSSAKKWQRNSINNRFYLLIKPQAFCVVANQLRFYSDQDITAADVNLSSTFSLLAESVNAATPFALTMGSENRNTVVQINIAFVQGIESILFNHSVMIRNVP